jgi:hypothetical protein
MDQLARSIRKILSYCSITGCVFALLAAMLGASLAAFLKYVDGWSAVTILLVLVGLLLTFLAGAVSGNAANRVRLPRARRAGVQSI